MKVNIFYSTANAVWVDEPGWNARVSATFQVRFKKDQQNLHPADYRELFEIVEKFKKVINRINEEKE